MQINLITKNNTWKRFALSTAALLLSTQLFAQNAVFDQPDTDFNAMLGVSGVVHPGDKAEVWGRGFKPGQEVQLMRNGQVLTGNQPVVADDQGQIRVEIHIPHDAALGLHPIIAQVAKPSAATVFDLKVSPKIEATGEDKFTLAQTPVTAGLYQVAYSAKNDVLFVTSAVGRPPVKQSQLSKVDPKQLKITQHITPAADPAREGQVMAVYGVTVDDKQNTVWVTNTRAGTVAVYSQDDLKLLKQFEHGSAPHARDVVVDETQQKAFVSSPTSNQLYVFDSKALKALDPITIPSKTRQNFAAMSLAYDAKQQRLYTVSRSTNELAVINTKTNAVETVVALSGIKNASGIAIAPEHQRAFVTGQSTDNVVIVDLKDNSILHNTPVGAGALNVAWDEASQLAYVAVRGADAVTVININGELVAHLPIGSFPNHITTDQKGHVYVVNKARGQEDNSADQITRIQPK